MLKNLPFVVVVFLVTVGLTGGPLPQWTTEQQAVIDVQQACWQSWSEGFDEWAQACRPVKDLIWWFPDGLHTYEENMALAPKFRAGEEPHLWHIRPHAVQIFDDTAVIYYSSSWTSRMWGTTEKEVTERRAEVFLKVKGQWCIAGGLVAPNP